jgi:hypothetical protein
MRELQLQTAPATTVPAAHEKLVGRMVPAETERGAVEDPSQQSGGLRLDWRSWITTACSRVHAHGPGRGRLTYSPILPSWKESFARAQARQSKSMRRPSTPLLGIAHPVEDKQRTREQSSSLLAPRNPVADTSMQREHMKSSTKAATRFYARTTRNEGEDSLITK